MLYVERQLLAANRILHILKKECMIYTNFGDNKPAYKPSYLYIDFSKIHSKMKLYSKGLIKDSINMLEKDGMVKIGNSSVRNIYDLEVGILDKGVLAYKENKYLIDFMKSTNVIIALIIISLGNLQIFFGVITKCIKILSSL